MGFEPTTFCMAITPVSKAARCECSNLQGFRNGAMEGPDYEYATICADMPRFGNFGAEVPEIGKGGLIDVEPSPVSRQSARPIASQCFGSLPAAVRMRIRWRARVRAT
jgi:hypothetical protein